MSHRLPYSVTPRQPHAVRDWFYRLRMASLKEIVAANVRRLLRLEEGESGVSKLIRLGVANGTAQRVLGGTTAIGVDVLDSLARKLHVEPWQLLVENLDPDRMPTLRADTAFQWPFRQVDFDAISGLVGTKAADVERGLVLVLAGAGVPARKRTGTNG